MRIFTRYILGEILSHALLGGLLFTFVLLTRDLGHLLELIIRNSQSAGTVLAIFACMLPNIWTVTIPMAVLVGILLGLSRLAADSEVIAMRASGVGVWRFVGIASVVAFAACAAGLANTCYLAPHAWATTLALEDNLKNAQASFEVQPRVFYEDFKNVVLYVDDVRAGTGASQWREVFLADMSNPASPRVTTANSATVVNTGDQSITMRMRDGTQHQLDPQNPNQYDVSTFAQTDLPLAGSSGEEDMRGVRGASPAAAMDQRELVQHARTDPNRIWYQIELQKRYSYPVACLVLMLVGVPLGMSSARGGKSAGFVLTIVLVFVYYFLSSVGVALARQGKLPVLAGVWGANVLFGLAGLLLLQRMSRIGGSLPALPSLAALWKKRGSPAAMAASVQLRAAQPTATRRAFPLMLDEYVVRRFLTTLALVLSTFLMLMLLFTFFELLGDIIRNRTSFLVVGDYLLNLTPSMIYTIAPLSVLIAVLVVFGTLNRTNELTAMKATGISIYRVTVPILAISTVLAGSLFAFDQQYIPSANRRQEALRAIIKGKPPQTFERPDRKWIFGIEHPGEPKHIFYYQAFDPDRDTFANISVFEFAPGSFTLTRRTFAASAHWDAKRNGWVFERGWTRAFRGEEISTYEPFTSTALGSLPEQPSYFKKEQRQSTEMSFSELSHYIADLRQSGFDTMRLRVQLNHKLAYPLITLVMAVLAVPFALSMGRSGSLTGIAAAIGVAIVYWVVAGAFEAMGDVNMLPAILAAWSPDLLFALVGTYMLLRTPT